MSYTDIKKRIAEQGEPAPKVKMTYRCKANGCPNTGCIDHLGIPDSGVCFFHWIEHDASSWPRITQQIRENFQRMRNH